MKLSILSPWYKSKDSVIAFFDESLLAYEAMPDFSSLEFIFVEDGGNDGTWEELERLAQKDERVKAFRLSRNFGQHHALTACLDLCDGDWVVVMDCDLQDRPEEIPNLWKTAKQGFDMVCARRGVRKDRLWKRISSQIFFKIFNYFSGLNYDSQVGNFRIMSRKVVEAYRQMPEATRTLVGQLQWLGFSVGYVNVQHGARYSGNSSYSLGKLVALALDSILAYSNRPLQFSIRVGFGISLISLFFAGWIMLRAFVWGIPVSGWASLMVSLWFIGGMILANLGIIALFVGKIYNETKHRPIYIIAESINAIFPEDGKKCKGFARLKD